MLPRRRRSLHFCLLFLLLWGATSRAQEEEDAEESDSEAPLRALQLETLGALEDGPIIDSSLSREPLQVVLGKRQIVPGLEQGLLDMCVGEKRKVIIPPHLAYGKRGSPPAVPANAVLQFEVELVGLSRAGYWQKLMNDVLPLLCIGLVPALLGLIGYHLYQKVQTPSISKKRLKEEKRNKAKKK